MGFCTGEETGCNLQYNMGKWGFIAKKQGRGAVDGKLLRRNVRSKGGFWLNESDRILAAGRTG